MAKLSARERAFYALGLRRARTQARRAREALADQFEDTVEEINREMREVRAELTRRRTFDDARVEDRALH